jgi:hypothetical protein
MLLSFSLKIWMKYITDSPDCQEGDKRFSQKKHKNSRKNGCRDGFPLSRIHILKKEVSL